MSIDMYLGDSDRQNQSVSSIIKSRSKHYNNLQGTLVQFSNASPFLSGVTYDSAKNYSQKILIPLIKAGMLLDEAVKESCESFTKKYREEVDTVDLRESELLDKINRVEIFANQARNLMSLEFRNEHPNATYLRNLQRIEDNHLETKRLLEEKLAKLRDFNSNSRAMFAKADELYQLVQKGINEATHSWSEVGRSYLLNEKAIETWMESINQHWINSSYYIMAQMAEIMKKGLNMSEDEFERLKNYLDGHPKVAFYNEGIQLIERYQQLQFFKGIVNDFAWSALEENVNALLNKLNDAIPSVFKHMNFFPNLYFSNINVSFDATGYNKAINKAFNNFLLKSLTQGVNIPISNITNFMGFELKDFRGNQLYYRLSGLNLLFSSLNFYQNLQKENIGRAIVHTGFNMISASALFDILASGVELLVTATTKYSLVTDLVKLTSVYLPTSPLTWTIVGTVVVGSAVTYAYENNMFGIRDIINSSGDRLNKFLMELFDNVGTFFDSNLSSLHSVFGG